MKQEKEQNPGKNKKKETKETDSWVDKAHDYIDEKAERIHQSEGYQKADKTVEDATKKLFRTAGKWWGKSEKYLKNKKKDKD
jgi:hypothetical protein